MTALSKPTLDWQQARYDEIEAERETLRCFREKLFKLVNYAEGRCDVTFDQWPMLRGALEDALHDYYEPMFDKLDEALRELPDLERLC